MKLTNYCFDWSCESEGNKVKGNDMFRFTDIPVIHTKEDLDKARNFVGTKVKVAYPTATNIKVSMPFSLGMVEVSKTEIEAANKPAKNTAKKRKDAGKSTHSKRTGKGKSRVKGKA